MRGLLRLKSVFTFISIVTSASVSAEAVQATTALDAVTVYATRSPQSKFDVPAIVSTVDPTAAGNTAAGDVGDLLEFVPGVEVDNGPRRNGQTISIRGFDDESIITLMDGRRQNFESAHDGRFFIDPSLLKRVEVVKGASSAIYGGGAVGGVVAFETKDAADFLNPGETSGVYTSFGYRSANDEIAPIVTGFYRTNGWDILASINYRDSGDIEQGDDNKLDAEDEMLSALFKAGYTFNDFHTLKFQAQLLNNDGQEPNNGAGPITASNPLVDKTVKDSQFSVKYAYENPDNNWLNPKLHLYYNDTEVEEQDIVGSANAGRVQVREINTLGFTVDNQSKLAINDHHQHTLSYGFEIYNDEQTGKNSFIGSRAGVPDAEATNYGFYLQDELALKTSFGEFLIIPAARYDHYKSDDENGNDQDESKVSPKLSATYKPNDHLMVFGSAAKAFRAPNLTELYPSGQHFPGVSFCPAPVPGCPPVPIVTIFPDNNFIPNPDLKPEVVTTFEVGAGLSLDNLLVNQDQVQLKGAYFNSRGKDFITQEVNIFAGTTRNFNVDKAKIRGWELEGQYQYDAFTARLGLSYVNAKDDDTGEYLSNNVPLTLVTDVSYKIRAINGLVGWRGRFAEHNNRVGDNDAETDGYAVHDIYYRWVPNDAKWKTLTVDLGVENLFDEAYTKRFASLLEEGRSYVARISYQW